jgi:hypothetical protein
MKISILFYSLFIGLSIYSLLVFSDGDTGLKAMSRVESYRELLNDNLEKIREINEELTIDFDSLTTDNEMIKLKARALGYFDKEDHLVHVANWNPDYNEYKPGHIIKREYLTDIDETSFRMISFSFILFSFTIMMLMDKARKNRR